MRGSVFDVYIIFRSALLLRVSLIRKERGRRREEDEGWKWPSHSDRGEIEGREGSAGFSVRFSVRPKKEKGIRGREGPPFSEAILECYATAGQCIWPGRALWPNLARAKMFVLTRCPSRCPPFQPARLPASYHARSLELLGNSRIFVKLESSVFPDPISPLLLLVSIVSFPSREIEKPILPLSLSIYLSVFLRILHPRSIRIY